MTRCPLITEKKATKKATVRVTEDMRQEIIRRSFELFEKWHGISYDVMVVTNAMAANAQPKGICQAGVAIANEYGLSHNQRYHVLGAVLAHSWARQEKAYGQGEYKLTWNKRTRRYDREKVSEAF